MAKKKKEAVEAATDAVVAELTQEKPLLIVQGTLNDEFCNYGIQINTGPTKGMIHMVKGKPNIVHEDLSDAFQKFRPHLAALSNAYDWSGIELNNFQDVTENQLVDLFHVTGFKIKGAGEAESIALFGSYHSMTANGRVNADTDFISLEEGSDYQWYNELREAADLVRSEIEQYNNGKCTPPPESEQVDKKQLSIVDAIAEEQD